MNMCNLITQVFRRILRILTSLPITLRLTAHLTRCRSRRLRYHIVLSTDESDDPRSECWYLQYPIWVFSRIIIWYLQPLHPSTRDARHEHPRREIWPKDTYSLSFIRRMFRLCWCIFLFLRLWFVFWFIWETYFIFLFMI
jgi:hypothetical protein